MDRMIGERIKKKRKELHLTQVQIKELCGISNGNLSELENGNRLPSAGALVSLSQVLGVTTDWILTGKESPDNIPTRIYLTSEEEKDLIKYFRQLDPDDRSELVDFARLKIARRARGGAGSSSSDGPDLLKNTAGGGVVSA